MAETIIVTVTETDVLSTETFDLIDVAAQGPMGPQGPQGTPGVSGAAAGISTDPDNRLAVGSDSGLYCPEILIDPLAYYILSRS